MKLLHLLPVGELDGGLVAELAPALAEVFRIPCALARTRSDPEFAYHREREQYHSSEILHAMQAHVGPDSWRVLGVTTVDLYIPILTFVFGEAQIGGPCGLISAYRLVRNSTDCPAIGRCYASAYLRKPSTKSDTRSN